MTNSSHDGSCPFCDGAVDRSESLCPGCGARYGVFARKYSILWNHENQEMVREVMTYSTARQLLVEQMLMPIVALVFVFIAFGIASYFTSGWILFGAVILGLVGFLAMFDHFFKAIGAIILFLTLKPEWISSETLAGLEDSET
jgi:hypothetical protein